MENALIKQFISGDKKAFKIVFDKYYNALCAFTYKYIPDQSEIEDIVQDVFISFWEHKKAFDHEDSLKAYLFTSTRNKCLNTLKHNLVKQKHEASLIYELESEHFFIRQVIEEDTFNLLYQEINELPLSAQKIMLLALKGRKNKEIAEKLRISENTVKTQKKIAYAKIKANLGPAIKGILLSL